MKQAKKVLAVVLALVMAFSFAACGKKQQNGKPIKENEGSLTWYVGDGKQKQIAKDFVGVKDTLDPKQIISSLNLNEQMIYGSYGLADEDKDIEDVRKNISFVDKTFDNGTFSVSSLPISVLFGSKHIYDDGFKDIEEFEVAKLRFATADDIGSIFCAYEINDNKIKFTEISDTSNGSDKFTYELTDCVFEYEFSLAGPYLTLSTGSASLKYISSGLAFNDNDNIWLDCYLMPQSPSFCGIDNFSLGLFNYACDKDGSFWDSIIVKLSDNGLITFILNDTYPEEKNEVKQFAYILDSEDSFFGTMGILLFDGEKIYDYRDSSIDREERELKEQGVNIGELSEEQIKKIAEKKANLFEELQKEFEAQDVNATINQTTGEIALDSTVLFGGDSAELTAEGKEFLNKFINVYSSIITNDTYAGFIEKTMIEGHIAPIAGATYESGMALSEERANNVKEYILSNESGIDTAKFANEFETIGYSQSKPVYDENGEVDIPASRRVSFSFIVNVENQ